MVGAPPGGGEGLRAAKLEVTYYSGDWSESDRGMVRGELESAGFEVTEGEGAVKGGVPPEALHLIVEAAHFAKDNAALLSVLLNSLIAIADRLYQRKGRASIRGGHANPDLQRHGQHPYPR